MRKGTSILLLAWVFLLAPAFCLGAIGSHDCGCAEADCSDCSTAPGEGSHGCHDDPCPKDACRTEQDESVSMGYSNGVVDAVDVVTVPLLTAACPANPCTPCEGRAGPPLLLTGADLFAFAGLPLLI